MIPALFLLLETGLLPPIDLWTFIGLLLGVLGIVVSVFGSRIYPTASNLEEAGNLAEIRQEEALAQLEIMILQRLNQVARGELDYKMWTTRSIRGLAYNIQLKFHSPVITDILIGEVLRSIALDVEKNFTGQDLFLRVKLINGLLTKLDTEDGRNNALLSIAETDPLIAYQKLITHDFNRGIAYLILLVSVFLFFSFSKWIAILVLFSLLAFLVTMTISGYRTKNFFEEIYDEKYGSFLSPKKLNPLIDLVSYILVTKNRYYTQIWAVLFSPIWEDFISYPVGAILDMHKFRFFKAYPLMERLEELQREHDMLTKENVPEKRVEYMTCAEQLWVYTGEKKYKYMIERAKDGIFLPSTKELKEEFERLNKKILLYKADMIPLSQIPKNDLERYIEVTYLLWMYTGEQKYNYLHKLAEDGIFLPPTKELKELEEEFYRLNKTILLYKADMIPLSQIPKNDLERYIEVTRCLFEVTGNEVYSSAYNFASDLITLIRGERGDKI
jgi:hypothetical protein